MKAHEAEIFLMAGLVEIPENFDKVRGKVFANDFENSVFSKVFGLIEEIDGTEGMPLDRTTFRAMFLENLTETELRVFEREVENNIGANESLPFWAKEVKRASLQRQLRKSVKEEIDTSQIDSILYELSSLEHPENPLYRPVSTIPSAIQSGPVYTIGFADIDRVLKFRAGHVMVIAGRTGLGKTSLGVQILFQMSKERPVAVISLEMPGEELRDRIVNSFDHLPKGFFVSDPPACSSTDFKATCKALKNYEGVKVFLLDYLQLMREKQDYRNRHLEISHIIRKIKEISKELRISTIIISQISRGIDARGKGSFPSLGDLKESGD